MLSYKRFSVAFSYPDERFFEFFTGERENANSLHCEYDRLFRAGEVWLYGSEHVVENEFERVANISDISAFYRAFGLEPGSDRPDAVSAEFEFMYYLIFKKVLAGKTGAKNRKQKELVCVDAQGKFFSTHLYPAIKRIVERIPEKTEKGFYLKTCNEVNLFLEEEKKILGC